MLTLTPKKMNLKSNLTFLTESYAVRESMETYQEKLLTVTNYCLEMTKLRDVTLNNPADWYTADFIQTYSKARSFPSLWISTNGILDQLYSIPGNIVSYNRTFQGVKAIIQSDAENLITNPSSEDTKEHLTRNLQLLKQAVCGYQEQTVGICSKISDFKASIDKYKQFFQNLYTNSNDTKKADESMVEKYEKKMDELNEYIKHWNAVKTDMYASMGVSGFAILVGLNFFGPYGIILGICCGAGLIGEGIEAFEADVKIKTLTEQLNEVHQLSDSYTKDADCLNGLVQRLERLNKMVDKTLQAIEGINQAWQQLDTNIDTLVSHLSQAEEDEEKALYQDLIDIMDKADTDWDAVVEAAKQLDGTKEKIDTENVYPVEFAS